MCLDLQSCFDKLEMRTDVALAISLARANGLFGSAFCFGRTHSIFEYELKFFVRKEFPFRSELNTFIGAAIRSGLIGKWLRDNQKKIHIQIMEPASYVKVEHLIGVWIIYSVIIGVTILLFIAEIIVHNRVRQPKTISWFWIFAEMFISPERCFLLEDLSC